MKKLLFIGIVALMVQSLGAVTLPSTSYSPYASSTSSTSESFITSGGTIVTGSYSVLGDAPGDVCKGEEGGVPPEDYATCKDCCEDQGYDRETIEGKQAYADCIAGCMQGPSLPLDGGLSILLILSLAGGAAKVLRNRRMHN